ncbi:hypothetical protein QAD02_018871 [Eretmocerus hayati]|uniref:Uncharacterized protein n=1 Tax=Eretmocerus hayati TaxID=131215 RepID=A0ACC2PHK8_9HYME|nr:hypothetical protein QAD02_018871 [Eretmocerus hayati]
MHHLVMWITENPPTRGVVKDKDFKQLKTKAKARMHGKWFDVEHVASDSDAQYLEELEVDVQGRIMTPRKTDVLPDAILLEKRRALKEKKEVVSARTAASETNESHVLSKKSIMSDESSDGETLKSPPKNRESVEERSTIEMPAITSSVQKKRRRLLICDDSTDDENYGSPLKNSKISKGTGCKNDGCEVGEEDHKRSERQEESQEEMEIRESGSHKGTTANRVEIGKKQNQDRASVGDSQDEIHESGREDEEKIDEDMGRIEPEENDVAVQNKRQAMIIANRRQDRAREDMGRKRVGRNASAQDETRRNQRRRIDEESVDYDEDYRKSLLSDRKQRGKVKLLRNYNIFIDAAELAVMKADWRNQPKEFARRLMHLIIGTNDLRGMTPTERGGYIRIPKKTFAAVLSK